MQKRYRNSTVGFLIPADPISSMGASYLPRRRTAPPRPCHHRRHHPCALLSSASHGAACTSTSFSPALLVRVSAAVADAFIHLQVPHASLSLPPVRVGTRGAGGQLHVSPVSQWKQRTMRVPSLRAWARCVRRGKCRVREVQRDHLHKIYMSYTTSLLYAKSSQHVLLRVEYHV